MQMRYMQAAESSLIAKESRSSVMLIAISACSRSAWLTACGDSKMPTMFTLRSLATQHTYPDKVLLTM